MPTFGIHDPGIHYADRHAAYAVIMENGRVAAVRSPRGGYFLPGGAADADETPKQTVLREIRGELNCDARLLRCLGEACQFFLAAPDSRHYRMQATFFTATLNDPVTPSEPYGDETLC